MFKRGEKRPPTAGRRKGVPNKTTVAMKEWASELFESADWRDSARARILKGKAPHLELHALQVLMPKQSDDSGPPLAFPRIVNFILSLQPGAANRDDDGTPHQMTIRHRTAELQAGE